MTPPEGSKIRVESERGFTKIIAPHGSGGVTRYLVGVFLFAWLGGWTFGWVAAFSSLVSGETKQASGFVLLWLIAWTIGGLFVFWFLFRLLRPSMPEEFLLTLPSLVYDSGVAPITMAFDYRRQMDVWKRMFKRRKRTEFTHEDLRTLRLREVDSGNRLTIDKGAERIDFGASLTEVEREWLFSFLAGEYKVGQGRGANVLPRAVHDDR